MNLRHDDYFNRLRELEFARLDDQRQIYLDYTGGNLYAESVLVEHMEVLKKGIFGNPHSSNPTSKLSTKLVQEARNKVVEFFNAEDYYCIFTPNASGALKIVGECYPFEDDGFFLLLADNHNSVNGIREYCRRANCEHKYAPVNVEDLSISEEDLKESFKNGKKNKLFAYPAQSNVSGIKHDLKWIEAAKKEGWDVLLDAAAYVPTSRLDLKMYKPDFVSVSFYKIFGYPTGLGCLLVRKNVFNKLNKKWFAGGTVSLVSVNAPYHFLVENHERFENGTINYLDIPALKIGLEFIESIGVDRINERIDSLMTYLFERLKSLRHANMISQVEIFGHQNREKTGGTMIVCFFNPDGNKIPFEKIEELANKENISIRSGCFCNPGIDEANNCLTNEELTKYFTTYESGDYYHMVKILNKMRGATRISVGIGTTKSDLDKFLSFVSGLQDKYI